ncbi:MAG: VCBS repeat-containing protein, partial [Candidatus Coatesbacteria bacterium]
GVSGGANLLYHNKKNGTFEEVAATAGVADANRTSGVCAGDFNADGHFDLYSVNISSPANTLYKNLGNGRFQNITYSAGVADVGDGRTATFLDIDYDGLVDLFSSNHVNPNRLYRNRGDETFVDIASQINIANPWDPFGTAFGDYDGDGDLDVFMATHFGNKLLRCDGLTNHWLVARLVGTQSNKNAIGARARLSFGGKVEYGQVDGGHGMGDSDSFELEFGMGTASNADRITVWWPSGRVESWFNLGADKYVTLTEGTGEVPVKLAYFRALPRGEAVALEWAAETAGWAGFNLYREEEAEAARRRLNAELIAGRSPFRFVDREVAPGERYRYWLEAVEETGRPELFGPVEATAGEAARALSLRGVAPNPAREATTITFAAAREEEVELELFDAAGRRLRRERRLAAVGTNEWVVDVGGLAPGLYLLRLGTATEETSGKLVVGE